MKTAILYYSKTGTAKKCADMIKAQIDGDLFNLAEKSPDIEGYDFIIIGFPFRMFSAPKAIRNFLKNNRNSLLKKKYALFFCGLSEDPSELIEKNIDSEIIKNAAFTNYFSGEINIENARGFDRFILKAMSKNYNENNKPQPCINVEKINEFCSNAKKLTGTK